MLLEACKGGHTAVARLLLETPLNNDQEYPFASIQPPLPPFTSSSPPRVPPVPSLDQLDANLPLDVKCSHHDLLRNGAPLDLISPGMLAGGVPFSSDFLSENLYESGECML